MLQQSLLNLSITQLLYILSITFVICWVYFTRRQVNYPPSPGFALPLIGHCHLLDQNPRQQFKKWANELGSIFSIQMGSIAVVVINGYDLIKEALVMKADYFSGRPDRDFISRTVPEITKGLILSSGNIWKEQRTLTMSILRNLGMGKNVLAERISDEVSCYIAALVKLNGEPKDIHYLTNACVANIICSMLRGKRYDLEDPVLVKHLHLISVSAKLYNSASIANFLPFLRYIPYDPFQAKKLLSVKREIIKFSFAMLEEFKLTSDLSISDTFIASYLHELHKKKSSGEASELSEENLRSCIDDLVIAGSETVTFTIAWSLLYALHFPEKQEKVYQEILDEVGASRAPTLLDKTKLKYLNAYIMEIQRIASIAPFNVPYLCTDDVTLGGYFIPKGTQILPSLDSVLHDEQIWGDPQNFRPERFLDDQGNLKSDEHLIPFSMGRRVCPGESLAKMEIFLLLSSLFHRFQFLPKDPDNLPPLKDVFGITAPPVSYEIRSVDRIV